MTQSKHQNIIIINEVDSAMDNYPNSYARKPKCCTMCCLSFVATIFFLIGLFQTVVALVFVEASRRNPILIMGPMFMAIGGLLYMGVFEMCRTRRKMQKVALNGEQPSEEEDEGNLHMNANNTVIIRADQLPQLLSLNAENLHKLTPDEKKLLLAQPSLPPVDICSPAPPAYYSGNTRIPQVANYTPPEDGEPITVMAMVAKDGEKSEDQNFEETGTHEVDEEARIAQNAQQEISEALTKILVEDSPSVQ